MTTSRQKLRETELQSFKDELNDELIVKFGDEIDDDSVIDSALYIFNSSTYDNSSKTWFMDWQNGRWHVSLQNRTHDYRGGELESIAQLINPNHTSV